jgi:hypothetical protein
VATNVFAVGISQSLYAWNGANWRTAGSFTNATSYFSVFGFSSTDIWIGGASTAIEFDGSSYVATTLPDPTPIVYAFWGTSRTDLWALGGGLGSGGTILHYNGSMWTQVFYMTNAPALYGGYGSASNDIWAVGNAGAIMHWNGTAWTSVASPTIHPLRAAFAVNPSEAWAVGDAGTIVHWNGTMWQLDAGSGLVSDPLHGVWAVDTNDVWVVGGDTSRGVTLHRSGGSWSQVPNPSSAALSAVWAKGPRDVFAAGMDVIHWNGSAWSTIPAPGVQILGLRGL